MILRLYVLLAICLFAFPTILYADDGAITLDLRASASTKVMEDRLRVALYIRDHGSSAPSVQASINKRMKELVAFSRGVEGAEVEVQNYHVRFEKYRGSRVASGAEGAIDKASQDGQWIGQQFLYIQGSNLEGIKSLASSLQQKGMAVSNLHFYVSKERRFEAKNRLIKKASDALLLKARTTAEALGTKLQHLKHFSIEPGAGVSRPIMASAFRSKAASNPHEVIVAEAKFSEITLTVEGVFLLAPVSF